MPRIYLSNERLNRNEGFGVGAGEAIVYTNKS